MLPFARLCGHQYDARRCSNVSGDPGEDPRAPKIGTPGEQTLAKRILCALSTVGAVIAPAERADSATISESTALPARVRQSVGRRHAVGPPLRVTPPARPLVRSEDVTTLFSYTNGGLSRSHRQSPLARGSQVQRNRGTTADVVVSIDMTSFTHRPYIGALPWATQH